jgi:hypothetical protein
MDNDQCDYRAPHGERCVLIYGHTEPHTIAPGDEEPGMDMDTPSEYPCHTCGALIIPAGAAVHQQSHEYVIGLQNRLTTAERALERVLQEMRDMQRDQQLHRGKRADPPTYTAGDMYRRYAHNDDVWNDVWEQDPPKTKKTVKRSGLQRRVVRDA